jgi:hypothetical protein
LGFVDDHGVFTPIDVPGAPSQSTIPFAINDSGDISGYYYDHGVHGFLEVSGVFQTLDDPLALPGSTVAFGVNSADEVAGYYIDANGPHGFTYQSGIYTSIFNPRDSSAYLVATGINNNAVVTGTYDLNGFTHLDGMFDTVDGSGQTELEPFGINNLGVLTGFTVDNGLVGGSFIATPVVNESVPEPSTWMFMLVGVWGLGSLQRFSRRSGQIDHP